MAAVKDGTALCLCEGCVPEIRIYSNINTILIKNMRKEFAKIIMVIECLK